MRSLQIEDWLDDLTEFPASLVSWACKEWRQSQTRRPMPAEIRKLCVERDQQARDRRKPHRERDSRAESEALAAHQAYRRRYQEAAEARELWAKQCGCVSFTHAMTIGLLNAAKHGGRYVPSETVAAPLHAATPARAAELLKLGQR